MKTTKILAIILFLPFLLCLQSCSKDDDKTHLEQLPKETQEGKNTFGCLINGKAWVNSGKGGVTQTNLDASYGKGTFYVVAKIINGDNSESMAVRTERSLFTTGTYKLGLFPDNDAAYIKNNTNCWYKTDADNTGSLEVTRLDTINFIVSGRFSFTVNAPGCEPVQVTDGRFDMKYGY